MCGTSFSAGDPIPKTSLSTYATYSGAGRSCKATPAAVLFYGYDYPAGSSANTGYEVADTTAFYMILDEDGDVYLVLVLDKVSGGNSTHGAAAGAVCSMHLLPQRSSGTCVAVGSGMRGLEDTASRRRGHTGSHALDAPLLTCDEQAGTAPPTNNNLDLTITSTGLGSSSVALVMYDDWSEESQSTWNGQSGDFRWVWNSCCTDGMAMGPLPQVTAAVTAGNGR